jgi:hypothetical protein
MHVLGVVACVQASGSSSLRSNRQLQQVIGHPWQPAGKGLSCKGRQQSPLRMRQRQQRQQ